ncbi:MAG: leucine-rich repeat domain-containing protein [Ruminococcaceae bacterium]|nr:leucine-rich repeat domain-containing protein [Oscillospiraceae bacterium]
MKKFLSILLLLILLANFMLPLCVSAKNTEQSNITTSFDEKTGTLTVSGRGKASDIFGRNNVDLFDFLFPSEEIKNIDNTVKHLIIGEGITEIFNCFNDMQALEDVTFPKTLERIDFCFVDCDTIKKVKFPKSLKVLAQAAFYDCDGLTKIKFSGPLTIGEEFPDKGGCESFVFCNLDSLKYVKIPDNSVLGGVFKDCENLKTVVLGANIKFEAANWSLTETEAMPPFWGCRDDLKVYSYSEVEPYNLRLILIFIDILLIATAITGSMFLLKFLKKQKNTQKDE